MLPSRNSSELKFEIHVCKSDMGQSNLAHHVGDINGNGMMLFCPRACTDCPCTHGVVLLSGLSLVVGWWVSIYIT